ncbi:MAG: alpha-2-macroglobulin family protein [Candidatus Micrarchaeia archaeon]
MYRKFVIILALLGMASAMWINTAEEYLPGETIFITISQAEDTLSLDIYNNSGESVFHETRAVESGQQYYYSRETFETKLESGEYRIVARDDLEEETAEILVTSLGIMAVIGPEGKGALLSKEDGSAIEGGAITLHYNASGKTWENTTVSGKNGIFSFDGNGLARITAEHQGEKAELVLGYYGYTEPYWRNGERHSSYIFSDKRLYQPGETVHLSAVIFKENNDSYETVGGEFDVEISGPEYDVVYSRPVSAVNSRISLDFPVDGEAPLGWYSVSLRKNDSYVGWYNFEVQEYDRPEIDVSLKPQEEVFPVNGTVRVDVETEYYFGGPVDAEVKFEIYRAPHYWPLFDAYRCCTPYWQPEKVAEGLVYTENGEGLITWNGTNQTGDYTVKVEVTDESEIISEAEAGFTVLEEVNLQALLPTMKANKTSAITILAFDREDEPLNISGELRIYKGYYYREENESRETVFETNFSTLDGAFAFNFTPEEYGDYTLEAEAGGAALKEHFYISAWDWWNWNHLEAELDKEEYMEGEEISLQVTSPVGGRMLLVSIGSGPEIREFEINPGRNTLLLEAGQTTLLYPYVIQDGERYGGYANYIVRGDDWIKVNISHEEAYRPGGVARIVIDAEKGGNRANAAASIAIVDQAIVDLSGGEWNDIYKYFYQTPLEDYSIRFSWEGMYFPRPMVMAEDAAYGKEVPESGAGAEEEEVEIREKFPETALWIPYLILEGGKKEVIWHIPDSLTTWNITVIANEGTAVGMGTSNVLVTKEVIGRMSPPSSLVVEDVASIPVTVFNYGEERETFGVEMECSSNLLILGSPVRYVSLEPGESVTRYIPVKALERGEGELLLRVDGGEGDALRLDLEIKENGVEILEGKSGIVSGDSGEFGYSSPEDGETTLYLHSSILSSAFESLDYLVNYPYGCIEQTMSGFLPNVVLVYSMEELGVEYQGEENLTGLLDEGLERIYMHQNPDGSWGWFRGQDERISAYVMHGLYIAKKTGIRVDKDVYGSGLSWLEGAESPYALFVLKKIEPSMVGEYPEGEFGALAECEGGKCGRLISMLDCAGDYCSLEYSEEYQWYHTKTEMTAYALETLVGAGEDEAAAKCVNWLMANKGGRYWRSTKDTALSVLSLAEYAKSTGELRSDYIATVFLDGEETYQERLGHKSIEEGVVVLPAGKHEIKITKEGYGPLYYTLEKRYWTEDVPEGEIQVERDYSKTVAKVGDTINVTLKINGSGEYVAIEDPIPMGAEIVENGGRDWWYYGGYRMEARKDRAVFFFDRLENDKVSYTLRVTHKGDYTALPAHAYNMYAPEVGGYSGFKEFTFYEKVRIEPHITEENTTLVVEWEGDTPATLTIYSEEGKTEHNVSPGKTEIFVESAEISYEFESEEEYHEAELGRERGADSGTGSEGDIYLLGLAVIIGVIAFLYLWKG